MGNLKHVEGRIITKVDIEQKNNYTFADGTTIRLERDYENLDRKYTQQVLGVVIDAEHIPKDALLLFHHNGTHETYQIFNHSNLSGQEIASGIKIFSIPERDCFFWKMPNENEWHPVGNYEKALRVYKPYQGMMQGIEPTQIKDTLYVLTGDLKGLVIKCAKAADYQITFRDPQSGQDQKIIRFRPNGDEKEGREPEAICILNDLTEKVNNGELLIGIEIKDAKPLNELVHGRN